MAAGPLPYRGRSVWEDGRWERRRTPRMDDATTGKAEQALLSITHRRGRRRGSAPLEILPKLAARQGLASPEPMLCTVPAVRRSTRSLLLLLLPLFPPPPFPPFCFFDEAFFPEVFFESLFDEVFFALGLLLVFLGCCLGVGSSSSESRAAKDCSVL